jgi:ferredoxin
MKRILILIVVLLLTGLLFGAKDEEPRVSSLMGKAELRAGRPYIVAGEYAYRLLLAPKAALDSLGFTITTDDELLVEGLIKGEYFFVTRIFKDKRTFTLRDPNLVNAYLERSSYMVDPQVCIGCRLCIKPCPTGAITMFKGKALIDPAKCIECGICIEGGTDFRGCPVRAISPVKTSPPKK